MSFNLISNIESCRIMIQSIAPTSLLYYSHIPTSVLALIIGFFVFYKNKSSLISKILLGIAMAFSLWCFFDLVLWLGAYNSPLLMLCWSLLGILNIVIFVLSLYFVYVFIDKKDISFIKKIILSILFLPILLLTPTQFNLKIFNITNCEAVENSYFTNYYYFIGLIVFLWIIILAIHRYRKAENDFKKQILFLTFGMEFFLVSFFTAGYIASALDNFNFELYGLFGMPIFLAFLAYLIVKFKAFNIKMIAVQALVTGLVIIIGSELFFTDNPTNQILILISLAISLGFGYMLIQSVKTEVQRKEELQKMSNSLALANDKLRRLDNSKSEFISIASHQLRTPLTAIKGFVSLLLEGSYGKVGGEIKNVLNKVYISNERLVDLVESLLNLSRIESGRMEYKFEPVKLDEVCREVFDTFIIRAKEKDLNLELKMPEKLPLEAATDRNKIREVISNLVDNGLKYTIKGGVKIKLSDEGENIRVAIIDTGIGVPAEEIPYLFSKFSRGKEINRLNAGGTGLGLHVGKRMVESLGGRIWIESKGANLGSSFIIEIPKEHREEE